MALEPPLCERIHHDFVDTRLFADPHYVWHDGDDCRDGSSQGLAIVPSP